MTNHIEPTVAELVTLNFSRARVFEQLGIDYCCGGNISLSEACRKQGLDPQAVQQRLAEADQGPNRPTLDPQHTSPDILAGYIESVYHVPLKYELVRLTELMSHVAGHHGQDRPQLIEAEQLFGRLRAEMEAHMEHEETELFPMFRSGVFAATQNGQLDQQLREEHAATGAQLQELRTLLDDYVPPEGACRKYQAMLAGLRQLEQDMHEHVHLENNVLLPALARPVTSGTSH